VGSVCGKEVVREDCKLRGLDEWERMKRSERLRLGERILQVVYRSTRLAWGRKMVSRGRKSAALREWVEMEGALMKMMMG